jgi:hypothetical protein
MITKNNQKLKRNWMTSLFNSLQARDGEHRQRRRGEAPLVRKRTDQQQQATAASNDDFIIPPTMV